MGRLVLDVLEGRVDISEVATCARRYIRQAHRRVARARKTTRNAK